MPCLVVACCTSDVLSCMRGKSVADLMPVNGDFSDHLAYGTPLLPVNPATARASLRCRRERGCRKVSALNPRKTPAQQAMAATMIGCWTTFARTGNPNQPGTPHWSPGTPTSTRQLPLVPNAIQPVDFVAEHQCEFWDSPH